MHARTQVAMNGTQSNKKHAVMAVRAMMAVRTVVAAVLASGAAACSCEDPAFQGLEASAVFTARDEAGAIGEGALKTGATLDFGDVFTGEYKTFAVKITNEGTDALTLTEVTLGSNCGEAVYLGAAVNPREDDKLVVAESEQGVKVGDEVANRGELEFLVTYEPDALGAATCKLTLVSDVEENATFELNFKGRGVGITITDFDFGGIGIQGLSSREDRVGSVTVAHNLATPVVIEEIRFDEAGATAFSANPVTVLNPAGANVTASTPLVEDVEVAAAGASGEATYVIGLNYAPQVRSSEEAPDEQTLTVKVREPRVQELKAKIKGRGLGPVAAIVLDPAEAPETNLANPFAIDFGEVGTEAVTRTLYVVNLGDAGFDLVVTGAQLTSALTSSASNYSVGEVTETPIAAVAVGEDGLLSQADLDASGKVSVTFEQSGALNNDELNFVVSDPNQLLTQGVKVGLSVDLPAPIIRISNSGFTGNPQVNQAQSFEVTVCNVGNLPLVTATLYKPDLSGPPDALFSLSGDVPNNATIQAEPNPAAVTATCGGAQNGVTFSIDFAGAAAGSFGAALVVESNDPTRPCDDLGALESTCVTTINVTVQL